MRSRAHPEVCQHILALDLLASEPDLPVGIDLILQNSSGQLAFRCACKVSDGTGFGSYKQVAREMAKSEQMADCGAANCSNMHNLYTANPDAAMDNAVAPIQCMGAGNNKVQAQQKLYLLQVCQ